MGWLGRPGDGRDNPTRHGDSLQSNHEVREPIMTVMDSLNTQTGSPLERVAALADAIRAGGNEAQQLRRVSSPTVDTLVEAGLFRFTIPRELGGVEQSRRPSCEETRRTFSRSTIRIGIRIFVSTFIRMAVWPACVC